MVRDHNLCSDINVLATKRLVGSGVGDDGNIFVAVDFKRVRPIGISLAATRDGRIIGLHQGLIPCAYFGVGRFPLSEITRARYAHQATERCTKDEAFHAALLSFPASSFKAMFVPRI